MKKRKALSAVQRERRNKRLERQRKRRESQRPKYKIELDKGRYPEHVIVAELIEDLMSHKKFSQTVIRGLFIENDLQRGNVNKLLEYHPEVLDHFRILLRDETDDGLKKIIEEQNRRIIELTNLVMGLTLPPSAMVAAPALKPAGLKPLQGAHALPMPIVDDDDTVVLKRDTNAGVDALANFMDAAFGLQ